MNAYDILGIQRPTNPPVVSVSGGGGRKHGKRRNRRRNNDETVFDDVVAIGGSNDDAEKEVTTTDDKNESHPRAEHQQRNITETSLTNDLTVEKYDPKITHRKMSIFEYAEAHTKLAEFIASGNSVRDYIDDVEIKANVNPAELAFHILKENKWDATINRGYELVSYSRLKINPQWEETIQNYFNAQHDTQKHDLFQPLGLL